MSEEWGTPISKEKIIDRRNRLIEYQKTRDITFSVGYQIIDENILDINYMIYEIERLQEENTILKQTMCNNSLLINENVLLKSIIKEAREYIEDKFAVILADDLFLDHDEGIERKRIQHILEILDKVGETDDSKRDV